MSVDICVVGAGVVGLTTAVALQQQSPEFRVRIISEKLSPDTTSNVAAGIFLWGPPAPDHDTDHTWAHDSWTWFRNIYKQQDPQRTGD